MTPSFFDRLAGDPGEKALKAIRPLVVKINSLEADFEKLSIDELKAKTAEFKERLASGATLNDLLPEAFAAVREAAKRTLKQRHFDVQLLGGIVLHQGKIAEMKTGEGKTLAATLPIYLNALTGQGVHVVTVNDYLAKRDATWMSPIYEALGLKAAYLINEMAPPERRVAYAADVTYGTNNEFGFDYLRDNMARSREELVQRELGFAIIDEVDSILIDEARTPLIISAPDEESGKFYEQFARIVPQLAIGEDVVIDEKLRTVVPTDEGISKIEAALGRKGIYESGDTILAHHIEQSLKAQFLFKLDKDYVVKDGEILIVDEFTGRLMPGRRYSEGLHQAIEAKEGVKVKQESKTLATITLQNYFRLYKKLSGMTGTAKTEEEEFWKIYGLEVVTIPTNQPMIRRDEQDLIYKTEAAKFQAIINEIKRRNNLGQPVLVGTIAIEKSELLSEMLKSQGIKHEVLNAKHHEQEAAIIAQAGRLGAVTVATNMAGRGVDIVLGGNPQIPEEAEKVKSLGGLHILGTERHESRRIDNQLRGRSGRQGDPGSSQFFISLEDDLLRIFGSDRLKNMMTSLRMPEDQPLQHPWISKSIESAQKRVEGHNFDIRKHLLEYDDVANRHREFIYKERRTVLQGDSVREKILDYIKQSIERIAQFHTLGSSGSWDLQGVIKTFEPLFAIDEATKKEILNANSREHLTEILLAVALKRYEEKEKELGETVMRDVERQVLLRVIDTLWIEHIDALMKLREGIGLRGFGQRDPLVEYKQEAFSMFERLQQAIAADVVSLIYRVRVVATPPPITPASGQEQPIPEPETGVVEESREVRLAAKPSRKPRAATSALPAGTTMTNEEIRLYAKKHKIGRNDPCPCGATHADGRPMKYKHCHGR
jgi:preprotein translocase subunit SecA